MYALNHALNALALAFAQGEGTAPRTAPQQQGPATQQLDRWMQQRFPHLTGISVMLAALVVLLWPGSPLLLGLVTFVLAMLLLTGLMLALRVARGCSTRTGNERNGTSQQPSTRTPSGTNS